ncbi:MAG: hypothetical protein ACREBS_08205 [Nitrososphaerales archaeon]
MVEVAGGVAVVVLGILFIMYLPSSPLNFATDAIFLGAGGMFVRRAYLNNKKIKVQAQFSNRRTKRQNSKQDVKKKH